MVYAELWKRDAARKAQKEQEEIEDRRRKNDDRNEVLRWQSAEISRSRLADIDKSEAEKKMLVCGCI